MTILINILLGVYVFVAVLMMLVILMQRPKSEGLGAAFGGGVTENIFGAQTTNVLTKVTGWLAAIFFLLTFVLSILYARKANTPSNLTRELTAGQTPAPVASATPVPGASVSPATAGSATPAASASGSPKTAPGASTTPAPSVSSSVAATTPVPAASPVSSAAPSVSASPKR
jgi:preprotein translocase subunit SecG